LSAEPSAILTFSIGPVHSFIGQARRIADLWAGSAILSDVTGAAVDGLRSTPGAKMIFPAPNANGSLPTGLPNRFVARVPKERASEIARTMEKRVQARWSEIVAYAVTTLGRVHLDANAAWSDSNASWRDAIAASWSWVPEGAAGGYTAAAEEGARLFGASRVYRPFKKSSEAGTKCAICGERNALPDGKRHSVGDAWRDAERRALRAGLARYFRNDQGRLCLVCAAKRLYPESAGPIALAKFSSFEEFQPEDGGDATSGGHTARPYFAVVTMDGDSLGERLRGKPEMDGAQLESYQANVSRVLSQFAEALRTAGSANLRLTELVPSAAPLHPPQLIYAGGEDVLFVADPRDALPISRAIQCLYSRMFDAVEGLSSREFTISAAVIFAHTSVPAGVLFSEAERLLAEKAKEESNRDSVAVAIHKRSGPPIEAAFRWKDQWVERIGTVRKALSSRKLASRQTYDLAEADRILKDVFGTGAEPWKTWLRYRLGQGEGSTKHVEELLELLLPFFVERKPQGLRIARFIAIEAVPRKALAPKDVT
jgi:CRISPR-associated protein Cmr2